MTEIVLADTLSAETVAAVAEDGVRVRLGPEVAERVQRGRTVLEQAIDSGELLYGVNTGLGPSSGIVIPAEAERALQLNLLRSHAAGVGDLLEDEIVRAALVVRLHTLGLGYSGVRLKLLDQIVSFLNGSLTPCVPRTGSVGASGDLVPSAHAFLPLIGEGRARTPEGTILDGRQALIRLGREPLTLQAKEALALLNGTHFMAATGALLISQAKRLIDAADMAAAASIEAMSGCRAAYDARVHELRRLPGQIHTAENIRVATAGSERLDRIAGKIHDPYSLRCVPQVHGAAREAVEFFAKLVDVDLNAVTDNPILFGAEVLSAGNFHGQSLALAFDVLRLALADLGSVSERRIYQLLFPPPDSGLPMVLTSASHASCGYVAGQFTAAALVSELRALASPVSIDSVPTAGNHEDHVSMGMTAASLARQSAQQLCSLLSVELLCACQGLDLAAGAPGIGVRALHELLRAHVPMLEQDRPADEDLAAISGLVNSGQVSAVLDAARAQAARNGSESLPSTCLVS